VVGSVEDDARLLEEAARLQPDVIVLDLHMPAMNGIDACRELTRTLPGARIIVLTAEDDAVVRRVVLAAVRLDSSRSATNAAPAGRG
jgi:DNA-binding NarL/FixJ family response regulator